MATNSFPWCYPTSNKPFASISRRMPINQPVANPTALVARLT